MLFDLLRLASIGQNMELLASLHQARQHHQSHESQQASQSAPRVRSRPQRYRAHQDFHCSEEFREPFQSDTQINQCKPLDLTVKNATEARQIGNKIRSARLVPLVIEAPGEKMVPNGSEIRSKTKRLGQHRKRPISRSKTQSTSYQVQPPHSATRLITSSTSPSSCSRSNSSASGSSSAELISSTNNNLSPAASLSNQTKSGSNQTGAMAGSKRQKHKNLKSHLCQQCGRSFSRSDMLTRHSRLHSGLKPYQCGKCKQVFSRSDHLSTHERTHTGEKPYQCERCAYSACRRDMITRHMRTHAVGPTDPARVIRRKSSNARMIRSHPVERVKCIKTEFNFERDDVSSSLEGNSTITGEENESDYVDLES